MIYFEKGRQFERGFEEVKDLQVEKIEKFIREMSSELKAQGVPVDEESRIDQTVFGGVYSKEELKKDKELVEKYQKKFYKKDLKFGDSLEKIKNEREKKIGEKIEILTTAIFYKNLRKDFIIVRSSLYDDIFNGVDNVIIGQETGKIICALDEVGDNFGVEYEKKKDKVLRRNIESNGAKIKYGFRIKQENDKMKLGLGERRNIPIFYLALPEEYIKEALKNFKPSLNEKSDYEEKLFQYFITSIESQIKALLGYDTLHPKLKKHLEYFSKTIKGKEIKEI